MSNRIYIVVVLCCTFISSGIFAQRDFDLSMRLFNESLYNPAAVGNHSTTSIFLHGRQQWVGLEGAPSTQAFSIDTYAPNINSGFGVSVLNDKIGVVSTLNLRLSYAYIMPVNSSSSLAFGMSAGLINWNKQSTGASVEDPNEPLHKNLAETSPDFDFGVEYKGPFKLGIVARHLFVTNSSYTFVPKHAINYWAYLSSRFNVSSGMSFEPVASWSHFSGAQRIEYGGIVYFKKNRSSDTYNDKFWLGLTYRDSKEVSILAGVNISSRIRLGYSFDHSFSAVSGASKAGTHEIFLAYQLDRLFYKEPECAAYRNSRGRR